MESTLSTNFVQIPALRLRKCVVSKYRRHNGISQFCCDAQRWNTGESCRRPPVLNNHESISRINFDGRLRLELEFGLHALAVERIAGGFDSLQQSLKRFFAVMRRYLRG